MPRQAVYRIQVQAETDQSQLRAISIHRCKDQSDHGLTLYGLKRNISTRNGLNDIERARLLRAWRELRTEHLLRIDADSLPPWLQDRD